MPSDALSSIFALSSQDIAEATITQGQRYDHSALGFVVDRTGAIPGSGCGRGGVSHYPVITEKGLT